MCPQATCVRFGKGTVRVGTYGTSPVRTEIGLGGAHSHHPTGRPGSRVSVGANRGQDFSSLDLNQTPHTLIPGGPDELSTVSTQDWTPDRTPAVTPTTPGLWETVCHSEEVPTHYRSRLDGSRVLLGL